MSATTDAQGGTLRDLAIRRAGRGERDRRCPRRGPRPGRGRAPRRPATDTGVHYVIALDPAFTGDRFAAIVGHRDRDGCVIVDRVTGWKGTKGKPVVIDATLDEVAAMAAAYNGARVVTDQYGAETIRQGLAKRGVRVESTPWTNESKVSALAAIRRVLYAGQLQLPDHAELVSELVNLEQRPTPSGRPRIAAPPGAHDDYATACLALVSDLAGQSAAAAGGSVDPGDNYHSTREDRFSIARAPGGLGRSGQRSSRRTLTW